MVFALKWQHIPALWAGAGMSYFDKCHLLEAL